MRGDDELASIRQQISDPNENGKETTKKLRQALADHPARQGMQPILERMMDDPQDEYPEVASWFVTDRAGNQVAGVFDSGNSETIGKNYSYRTYFTGFAKDVTDSDGPKKYPVVANPSSRPIIENPHLSASFFSQASGLLKVAFSVPLRGNDGTVIGIVAATVNLGRLGDFQNEDNHYVVLVDTRKDAGDREAGDKILEHPLFLKAKKENKDDGIPKELTDITIDMEKILSEDTSADPFGKTSMGALYDRQFIVAREEVIKDSIKKSAEDSSQVSSATDQGGIHVLAFEDYESVLKPSRELSARLGRLALFALLILLLMAIGMWMAVNRLFRESRRRLVGSPDGATGNTFTGSSIATASPSEPGSTTRG
jgi:hypothetical protein